MTSLQRSLLVPIGLLLALGLLVLSSISRDFFMLQLIWIVLGVGILFFFHRFDWRSLVNYDWFIYGVYGAAVVLLVATYFAAPVIRGNRAWLVLGPVQFQTAELAKVALVLLLASFFAMHHVRIARLSTIFTSGTLTLIPMGLILLQPDLGSAMVLGALWFGFLLMSGLPVRYLAVFLLVAIAVGVLSWYNFLQPYHKERIIGLFNPEVDPLGVNWSITQSKIAIGSAGLWGKGYGQGTQIQLGFLPEPHSDFIFAALIEEWGLAGGTALLLIFVYLIFIILKIGVRADTNLERFIALGAATVFSIHFFINIGSTIGVLPVVGLPLSFVSYGGSHMVASFMLSGMLYSIAGRIT